MFAGDLQYCSVKDIPPQEWVVGRKKKLHLNEVQNSSGPAAEDSVLLLTCCLALLLWLTISFTELQSRKLHSGHQYEREKGNVFQFKSNMKPSNP